MFESAIVNFCMAAIPFLFPIRGPIPDKNRSTDKKAAQRSALWFGHRSLNHYSFAGRWDWGCSSHTSPQSGRQEGPCPDPSQGDTEEPFARLQHAQSRPCARAPRPAPAQPPAPPSAAGNGLRHRLPAPQPREGQPAPTPAWVPAHLRGCRPLPDEQAHRVPPRLARPPEEARGVTGTGRDISPAPPDRSGAGPGRLGGAGGGGGGPAPSSAGTPGW